jgi:uncharacterized protein (DUF362 family)
MSRTGMTRREFLRVVGTSSLALALPMSGGCPARQAFAVSFVKASDDAYALKRAIDLVGGLDFLNPGDSVLLKLALNSPKAYPATTSPLVVSELTKLLRERGAGRVLVGDRSPTWQDTMSCMENTGILDATTEARAEAVVFEDEDMVQVTPQLATHWPKGFSVPNFFSTVDHIIVLPTLRTHFIADFTMGLKSFVGAIPQNERSLMHGSPGFFKKIAEIALCTDKIRLSILDGREGFSEGGPDSGTLIAPGIMLASKNIVAADAAGLALLKNIGTTPDLMNNRVWDHPTIKRGVEVYGPSLSSETMELRSEGVDNINELLSELL